MCFRNLPIEVDEQGKARVKPGAGAPYSYVRAPVHRPPGRAPERMRELLEGEDSVPSLEVDVIRAAGDTTIDLHALVRLVDRGCPPDTAIRIEAPLDWEPAADERSVPPLEQAKAELAESMRRAERIARHAAELLRPRP